MLVSGLFRERKLDECERKLKRLAAYPKEIERVPKVLSEYGIRLVVIEPIPNGKNLMARRSGLTRHQ